MGVTVRVRNLKDMPCILKIPELVRVKKVFVHF